MRRVWAYTTMLVDAATRSPDRPPSYGTTNCAQPSPALSSQNSQTHEDDEPDEEEEAESSMRSAVSSSGLARRQHILTTKAQSSPAACSPPPPPAKTISLSDDVLSSITRSFEHDEVGVASQAPSGLAKLLNWSIDPDSAVVFYWKAAVTLAIIYNCAVVILRTAFADMRQERIFAFLDLAADVVYLLDIFIQSKTSFLYDGCAVTEVSRTFAHYKEQEHFTRDVLAVCPTHTLVMQLAVVCNWLNIAPRWLATFWTHFSVYHPTLRLNRLVKSHAMDNYFQRTESRTNKPNLLRAFKLSIQLGLVIHWIACLYYMLSEYEGFGINEWVYPLDPAPTSFSKKYILCMFWSTMTLTTIGERPPPTTELEYIFTGLTFLIGVFVFAAVVGNVGDVISNMNAARRDFQARMDQIKFYMDHRHVPDHLQNRIKRWAEYTWDRTKAIDEASVLQFLPDRLRTEVAIHVHLDTLKKVSIFEDCEEGLLRELVLKLRPQIFSPGDYICRLGEIGREMYIINHGKVEILFPDVETGTMRQVAIMHSGNFFGEISLLKLDDGQNKRTADVRSIGFSELLCLSRRDLMVALTEYPEAKRLLEEYARQRFNNTKRLSPPDTEESRSTSPRNSSTALNKRSARQIFSQVMQQEGFKHLLARATNNTDLLEIKQAVDELRAAQHAHSEGTVIALQRQVQDLGRQLLDKSLEQQQSQAHIAYLETVVKRLTHQCAGLLTNDGSGSMVGNTSEDSVSGHCHPYLDARSSDVGPCADLHTVHQEVRLDGHTHAQSNSLPAQGTFGSLTNHSTSCQLTKSTGLTGQSPRDPCAERRHSFRSLVQKHVQSSDTVASGGQAEVSVNPALPASDNEPDGDDLKSCSKVKDRRDSHRASTGQSSTSGTHASGPAHVISQSLNVGHCPRSSSARRVSAMDDLAHGETFSKSKIPVCTLQGPQTSVVKHSGDKQRTDSKITPRDRQLGISKKSGKPGAVPVETKSAVRRGASCNNTSTGKTWMSGRTSRTHSLSPRAITGQSSTRDRPGRSVVTEVLAHASSASANCVTGSDNSASGQSVKDTSQRQVSSAARRPTLATGHPVSGTDKAEVSKPRSASVSLASLSDVSLAGDSVSLSLIQRSLSLDLACQLSSSPGTTDYEDHSDASTDLDDL